MGNIYVSSTTDNQEAVEAAADYGADVEPQTEEEKPEQLELPEVEETETVAAQEPAQPESEEEEEEPEEEGPQEEEEPPPHAAKPAGKDKYIVARALRQRDEERQKNAELQQQIDALKKAAPPAQPTALKEPKQTDLTYFENGQFNFERFTDDRTRWFNQQEKLTTEQKAQDELNAKIQAGIQQRVSGLMDRFKAQYPDAEFIGQGMPLQAGQLATDVISRMKTGSAEVLDYLYRTPEVRTRLENLYDPSDLPGSRDEMRDLLSDLQSQLLESKSPSNGSAPPPPRSPRPRTAPPAPIRPVGGASAVSSGGNWYRDDMSQAEYKAARAAGYGTAAGPIRR